ARQGDQDAVTANRSRQPSHRLDVGHFASAQKTGESEDRFKLTPRASLGGVLGRRNLEDEHRSAGVLVFSGGRDELVASATQAQLERVVGAVGNRQRNLHQRCQRGLLGGFVGAFGRLFCRRFLVGAIFGGGAVEGQSCNAGR